MSIREAKRNYILDHATTLFFEKGISGVTVRDIAAHADVGEATVYRYFSKKENLVVAATMKLQSEILGTYFSFENAQTGFAGISQFYRIFLKVYDEHPEFYHFISGFDSFAMGSSLDLDEYERAFEPYYSLFLSFYQKGLMDGSVSVKKEIQIFYLSTTHALMELCKKMTVSGKLLAQDEHGREEIECLIDLILSDLTPGK